MEYSKEFKQAISNFSSIEKDRLIFRLLKKDKILSQKLYFELIDEENVDQKRATFEESIISEVQIASKYISNPKYFMQLVRRISAEIALHVKVTSDKFGDISLNLLLVNEILNQNQKLQYFHFEDVYKLYIYILNKIFKALTQIKKLDQDYWLELEEILQEIVRKITENQYLAKLSMNNALNFNWFYTENIPDDIEQIMKNLKAEGFLK